QVEHTLDRSQGGLGVGLTLVRRLVELHGGSVCAFSNGLNQGSEFVVRLPLSFQPEPVNGSAVQKNGRAAPPPSRRVLVVDDNVDGAESLAKILTMTGHEVRVAHDGRAALAAAEDGWPQVVFLDIGLPGMDGFEVGRRLRKQPALEQVLLVALTGYARDDDRQQTAEAGFDHHLVKPVDPDELLQLLAPSETLQAQSASDG